MKTISEMLKELAVQTNALCATVENLQGTDYINDNKSFEYLTDKLLRLSEGFVCTVRDFSVAAYVSDRYTVIDNASRMQDIAISKDGEVVIIDLPFLLPKRKSKPTQFIGDPLRFKLEEAGKNADLKIRSKAIIFIIHIYDGSKKTIRCYDYDNLETKRMLDIITLYCLTDDGPQYCDVYHTMQISDKNKTRIIVMPVSELKNPKWSLDF